MLSRISLRAKMPSVAWLVANDFPSICWELILENHGITNPDLGMVLEKKALSRLYCRNPLFVLGANMVTVGKMYLL